MILFKFFLGSITSMSVSKYINDTAARVADINNNPNNSLSDMTEIFFFFDLNTVFLDLILFLFDEFLLA